ncbi:MAG: 30S ribosomal protein THX [Flammeovirgaceae bacterium]
MGKGDKKSKKGKISIGSYGNSRRKKQIKERLKRSASKKKVVATGGKEKVKKVAKKATA